MEYIPETNNYNLHVDTQPSFVTHESNYISKPVNRSGKKSFLIFKHNKYKIIPTESIAFFYIKYESTVIVCFDGQEYSVNYSLEHIQHLLSDQQFFRLNRQYLINFD